MLITLSPSKGQDFESPVLTKKYSRPADLKDSELLIKELRKIKSGKLQELMDVSSNIAELNVGRYQMVLIPKISLRMTSTMRRTTCVYCQACTVVCGRWT